ncbi:uncharacterized protein TrAtP1_008480 [Trichoderma atroviride]|uniref:uncharacterized protein n=1 Tax=Hypocrea atroviridis TaxID=63577 RepID=UPI00331DE3E2|nr:hypothetical protein TrAtP1_008480 [Trichoderma atroviride]
MWLTFVQVIVPHLLYTPSGPAEYELSIAEQYQARGVYGIDCRIAEKPALTGIIPCLVYSYRCAFGTHALMDRSAKRAVRYRSSKIPPDKQHGDALTEILRGLEALKSRPGWTWG